MFMKHKSETSAKSLYSFFRFYVPRELNYKNILRILSGKMIVLKLK